MTLLIGTRRNNREGTKPYQLPDGRWRAEVTIGYDPTSGKRQRKPVYGKTQALCSARLREALRLVEDGVLIPGKAPTLWEWLEYWLYNIAEDKVRHTTFRSYESMLRKWVRDRRLATIRLDKLQPEDFEVLYRHMRDSGLKSGSIVRLHRVLSRALKVAVQRKRLGRSPLEMVESPKGNEHKPFAAEVLTPAEARNLITAAGEFELTDGVRWMYGLTHGPRQGEALALGWDKIDLETGRIETDRSLYRRRWQHGCSDPENCPGPGSKARYCPQAHGGGLFFGIVKSDASARTNYLPAPLLEKFRALHVQHVEAGRPSYVDPAGTSVELVFHQGDGRPWTSEADLDRWRAFLASAGVSPMRVHDQRHTAATMLLLQGVDKRVVMEMMGWSQMSMLNRYQHVMEDLLRDASGKMGDALFGGSSAPEPEPTPEADSTVVSFADFAARRAG